MPSRVIPAFDRLLSELDIFHERVQGHYPGLCPDIEHLKQKIHSLRAQTVDLQTALDLRKAANSRKGA